MRNNNVVRRMLQDDVKGELDGCLSGFFLVRLVFERRVFGRSLLGGKILSGLKFYFAAETVYLE